MVSPLFFLHGVTLAGMQDDGKQNLAKGTSPACAGDVCKIDFTLPFTQAMARAKRENRLLFLKPIYGGVNQAGAKDYRCGSW